MAVPSKHHRLVAAFSFMALLTAGTSACAQSCEPQKLATKYPGYVGKVINIAATPGFPPFTYSDPTNLDHLTGLEVELIESALNCAGLKPSYELGTWSSILPTIYSGSADVGIGNINYTAARAEKVDFIVFMRNAESVVVLKGNPKAIKTSLDLCGKSSTATVGGSAALEIDRQSKACVAAGKQPIQFQNAAEEEAAYRQLMNGRVDFVMGAAVSALARVAKTPEFAIAYTQPTNDATGMIVRKGNDEMAKIIFDGLKAMEAKGTIKALMAKYGLPDSLLIPVEIRK